ncbi:GH23066 [Drosophila grimshawi]|uniref:Gustatory receptor n=1 Tax=Drosophila grimshawi TaxID=7222 RepID=B4JWL0_DROGR|nr:GH23066 [Drosophila grimshawi]
MVDPVQLILRIAYYYSRVLGVLNFEINVETGLARITSRASIYAILANGLVVILLISISNGLRVMRLFTQAGHMHEYLYLVVHGVRFTSLVATLFNRWWQRRRLIQLVNGLRRLAIRKPNVMRFWRRGIIYKTITYLLPEIVQVVLTLMYLWPYLTSGLALDSVGLYLLAILVNLTVTHYFFAVLNVHSHYALLNQEIESVFAEICSLEHVHRRATVMSKCCSLADQLEGIALTQSELQSLSETMLQTFEIQGLCIFIHTYTTIVTAIYYMFSTIKQNIDKEWNFFFIFVYIFQVFFYFADYLVTISNVLFVLDNHSKMVELMEHFSTISPGLDERLETVIESFQLQLKRNPLKISILGLYNVERSNVMSIISSLVINSLVLIQYDLQYKIVSKELSL